MTYARNPLPNTLRVALCLAALIMPLGLFAHDGAVDARQQTFASPEKAAAALAAAWASDNKADLLQIFGAAGVKLVSSGDSIADQKIRAKLAAAYKAEHSIEKTGAQRAALILGTEEFPFPIPLVERSGRWHFDTAAGVEEILDRRIGRNELNAIETCRAYVEAQRDYASRNRSNNRPREYAIRITSSAGKHDGLYWPARPDEEESPLGPLMAAAAVEGYHAEADALSPYHGYYYRILTQQGNQAPGGAMSYLEQGHMTRGFALVAFPAEYGNSGVMTFVVNQDGIVFEKNLGPDTARIAQQITAYNPDVSWKTP